MPLAELRIDCVSSLKWVQDKTQPERSMGIGFEHGCCGEKKGEEDGIIKLAVEPPFKPSFPHHPPRMRAVGRSRDPSDRTAVLQAGQQKL